MDWKLITAYLFITFVSALAVPINLEDNGCTQVCNDIPQNIYYESGKTYSYELDSFTSLSFTNNKINEIAIKAIVELSAHSSCEMSLQLTNVRLSGTANSQQLKQQLESNPIQFALNEGKVVSVCPSNDDQLWSVNVKKAIISALQVSIDLSNNETIVRETDIIGECDTHYKTESKVDKTVVIKKTKSRNDCMKKDISIFDIFGSETSVNCEQVLFNNIVIDAKCEDKQSLSSPTSASQMSSILSLRYISKETGIKTERVQSGTFGSLSMSAMDSARKSYKESEVLSLLRNVCIQITGDVISTEVTKTFPELVSALKSLSKSSIDNIEASVMSDEICSSNKLRDLFLDAISSASGESSSDVIVNAVKNNEISRLRALYMTSIMGFFSKQTEDEVAYVLPLLQSTETSNQELLLLSSVIHNFCEEKENCDQNPTVINSIEFIVERLQSSDENYDKLVLVKALENIGIEKHALAVEQLLDIITDTRNDDDLRVAAISAFGDNLEDYSLQKIFKVYSEKTESIEVRINAYQLLSRITWGRQHTPFNSAVRNMIRQQIVKEESNANLANYIRSRVKNAHNGNVAFAEPDNNYFVNSRNVKFQYAGFDFDTDIVITNAFQIPRAVTIRASLPQSDRKSQLIEMAIRQQGLDAYFKSLFSRNSNVNFPSMLKEFIELLSNEESIPNQSFIQVMIKIDGKNIMIFDSREMDSNLFSLFAHISKILPQTVGFDGAFATLFMDSQSRISSIAGIPLVFDLKGTLISANNFDISYQSDQMWSASTTARFITRMISSLIIEISTAIRFELPESQPEIKMISRITSSPMIDNLVEIKEGRILKLKIHLPHDRQTLFKYENDISMNDNEEVKDLNKKIDKQSQACHNYLSNILGIQLCNEISYSPAMETQNFEIYLTKTNKAMKSFEFSIESPPSGSTDKKLWKMSLNTPHALTDKEYAAEFEITNTAAANGFRIDMQSPWKAVSAKANVKSDDNENSIQMEIVSDNERLVAFDVGLESQVAGDTFEYKPRLILTAQNDLMILDGDIVVSSDGEGKERKKRDADSSEEENRIDSDKPKTTSNLRLKIVPYELDLTLKGTTAKSENKIANDITVAYKWGMIGAEDESLKLVTAIERSPGRRTFSGSFVSSQFPEFNAKLSFDRNATGNILEDGTGTVNYEINAAWSEEYSDKLKIRGELETEKSENEFKAKRESFIEITPLEVNYQVSQTLSYKRLPTRAAFNHSVLNYNVNAKDLTTSGQDFILSYEANKRVGLDRTWLKADSRLKIDGPAVQNPQNRFQRVLSTLSDASSNLELTRNDEQKAIRYNSANRAYNFSLAYVREKLATADAVPAKQRTLSIILTRLADNRQLYNIQYLRFKSERRRTFNLNATYVPSGVILERSTRDFERLTFSSVYDRNPNNKELSVSLESTQFPRLRRKLGAKYSKNDHHTESNIWLVRGPEESEQRFEFDGDYHYTVDEDNSRGEFSFKEFYIISPLEVNYEVNGEVKASRSDEGVVAVNVDVKGDDRTDKRPNSEFTFVASTLRDNSSSAANITYTRGNVRDIVYRAKSVRNGDKEYNTKVYFQWQTGKFVKIENNIIVNKWTDNERKFDIRSKSQRYDENEARELHGSYSRISSSNKLQINLNLESTSGRYVKALISRNGTKTLLYSERYSIAVDVSAKLNCLVTDNTLEVRLAGNEKYEPYSLFTRESTLEYQINDRKRENIKSSARVEFAPGFGEKGKDKNLTVNAELRSTQYPRLNYDLTGRVYSIEHSHGDIQWHAVHGLSLNVSRGVDLEKKLNLEIDGEHTRPKNAPYKSHHRVFVRSTRFRCAHEIKVDKEVDIDYENSVTRSKDVLVTITDVDDDHVYTIRKQYKRNGDDEKVDYLFNFNCPANPWAHETNLSSAYNRKTGAKDITINSYTVLPNKKRANVTAELTNNKERSSTIEWDSNSVDVTLSYFNNADPNEWRGALLDVQSKRQEFPYKKTINLSYDSVIRGYKYNSKTSRIQFGNDGNVNSLDEIYNSEIVWVPRNKIGLKLNTDRIAHSSEINYPNFRSLRLESSTLEDAKTVLNVTSTISDDLEFFLKVDSPDFNVQFGLDPRNSVITGFRRQKD